MKILRICAAVVFLLAAMVSVATATPATRLIGEEDMNKGVGTFADTHGLVFHKVNASTFKFTLDNTYSPDDLYPLIGLATIGNWRIGYTDNTGVFVPLSFGVAGQYLMSNGASAAPSWGTPSGAGDMLQAVYDPTGVGKISLAGGGTGMSMTGLTGFFYMNAGTPSLLSASSARSTLSLVPGVDVQPYDSDLTALAAPNNWRLFYSNGSGLITELALGLSGEYLRSNGTAVAPSWDSPTGAGDMLKSTYDVNDDGIIDLAGGGTGASTAAGARTNLALGTMALQNANAVSVNGGTIDGVNVGSGTPAAGYFTSLVRGSVTDLNFSYLAGVTSNIQTQLNAKAPTASPTFTGPVGLPATTSIGNVSATELSYLDNATSEIQAQLNAKQPLATNLTTLATPGNWKFAYSNGSGLWILLPIGADNTFIKSNGPSAAPTWSTPASVFTPDNVAITGGAINGTVIGGTAPAAGSFSSLIVGAVGNNEIGYLNGVTSGIQAQLNAKQNADADLNTLAAPTAWRIFYSNGTSTITQLALGISGQYLQSNGASSIPSWSVPAGSGDMLRSIYDTNSDGAVDIGSGGTGAKTASGARTALGIGTLGTQNADNVAITGGTGVFSNLSTTRGTAGGVMGVWEGTGGGNEYRAWGSPNALSDNLVFRFASADPPANSIMLFGAPSGDNVLTSWATFAAPLTVGGASIGVDVGTGSAQVAAGNHAHAGTYEPVLGNPGVTGYVLSSTTGGVRSWVAQSGGMSNVVEDTTPQLGGTLDTNGHAIDNVTPTELNYVHGVNSNIQSQLDAITAGAIQLLSSDPSLPASGTGWINTTDNTFKVSSNAGIYSTSMTFTSWDTSPTAFNFTDNTDVATNTVIYSDTITVAGINYYSPISISGNDGEYRVNGGSWTSSSGNVVVGDNVALRQTSSASNSTAVDTILTIGGYDNTWSATTVAGGGSSWVDNLTRASYPENPIASGWQHVSNQTRHLQVVSPGELSSAEGTGAPTMFYFDNCALATNQYAHVNMINIYDYQGPFVRYTAGSGFYYMEITTGDVAIYECVGDTATGNCTMLGTAVSRTNGTGFYRLEASGSGPVTLTGYFGSPGNWGSNIIQRTDSSAPYYTGAKAGVNREAASSMGGSLDDFECGDL